MPKYYIVPAEVFESNFPEDYEMMEETGDVASFSTDADIKVLAKKIEAEN